MAIYRGPGGSGDATNDATSQSIIATQAAIEAAESAVQAASSATIASNSASNALASENAAETAEANAENAQAAAEAAQAAAEAAMDATIDFGDSLSVQATTLDAGSDATVVYDSNDLIIEFGIPRGERGIVVSDTPPSDTNVLWGDTSDPEQSLNLDSSHVDFTQSGSGAVLRSAKSKMRETISVKDFGAVGDGVTDDTDAIKAAINAGIAASPATIYFPAGTYRCNSELGSFTGNNITIDLNTSTLDFSSLDLSSTGPLLEFAGTYSTTAALTSDASATDTVVNATSTAFSVGDMVRIYSNQVFDSTRTSTRVGEIDFIESVPGNTSVTLTLPLQGTYGTSYSATIQKLVPVKNITIRNGTIIGPSGNDELLGLRIRVGYACLIQNIKSYDVDKIHIQLTDCVYSKVTECHIEQSNHSSQAYGVSFADACQDCTAVNNSFIDVRHSLSTNNNVSTSYGITRRILFSLNVVADSAKATGGSGGDAIDTHAGSEDIFITNNTVNASSNYGVNFEARTGTVSNNFIRNTASGGIYINPRADSPGSATVNNNTLLNIGNAAAEYGILVSLNTADMSNCVISGNRVVSFAQPIRVVGQSTYYVSSCSVTGNNVQVSPASTTQTAIELTQINYASVTGNSTKSNNIGVFASALNNSTITGNSIEIFGTSGANAYGVRLQGTTAYTVVSSNSMKYSATGIAATYGVSFAPTVTYSGAWNNITQGFETNIIISTGTGNVQANNI